MINTPTFPKPGKEAWLEEIRKDLGSRSPEDFVAHFGDGLAIHPFLTEEDRIDLPARFGPPLKENTWLISERIAQTAPDRLAARCLAALEGGASALSIPVTTEWTPEDFEAALSGIYPDYVFFHFTFTAPDSTAEAFFSAFSQYLQRRDLSPATIRGSFSHPSGSGLSPEWQARFTGLKTHFIAASETGDIAEKLGRMIIEAERFTTDHTPDLLTEHLVLEITAGDDFYLNIAVIRALRLVWSNVLLANRKAPDTTPFIRFMIPTGGGDPYTRTIAASVQALAAAIGGADLIEIEPFNFNSIEKDALTGARIARNVQHLLQMEAFTNKVSDPAQGSYFTDRLTRELALGVWQHFISNNGTK